VHRANRHISFLGEHYSHLAVVSDHIAVSLSDLTVERVRVTAAGRVNGLRGRRRALAMMCRLAAWRNASNFLPIGFCGVPRDRGRQRPIQIPPNHTQLGDLAAVALLLGVLVAA